jgi:hypothetical protein
MEKETLRRAVRAWPERRGVGWYVRAEYAGQVVDFANVPVLSDADTLLERVKATAARQLAVKLDSVGFSQIAERE